MGTFTLVPIERVVVALISCALGAGGTALVVASDTWARDKVVPVVVVEPWIGGFRPIGTSAVTNSWSKSEVKPVVLLESGIHGFKAVGGSAVGNQWTMEDVIPIVLVRPSNDGFVPTTLTAGAEDDARSNVANKAIGPSIIESQIDGEFEGWEGETVVRLINGQVWQQTDFAFEYHYSFMPNAMIYHSTSGYKMRVDGMRTAVSVMRIR